MLNAASLKFFDELLRTSGPSGFEIPSAKVFRERLEAFAHEVYTDVSGNTIGILNPDSPFRIMLAGHYDEIGFQVVYITGDGLITFRAVGGVDKVTLPALEVDILTANGKVPGVIGRKPIHLQTPKERETVMEINELWIDIGAESREEAEKLVSVGDPVAFRVNAARFGKHRIMSKGLDDKIGAFVIAEAFRLLSERGCKLGVYAVGTVQEELGLRGSKTSSFAIDPQAAIAVDVGFATDVPGVEKKQWGDVTLGGGPIIGEEEQNSRADRSRSPRKRRNRHRADPALPRRSRHRARQHSEPLHAHPDRDVRPARRRESRKTHRGHHHVS